MGRPRIFIIGAAIGGLALAQGLRRRNIDFAVFERDGLMESRLQGYRIKIMAEMKEKLKGFVLDEAWSAFEGTCGKTTLGETNVNAPDAAILACRESHLPEGAALPYTADRGLVRQAMMNGIQDSVHFGKHFARYEITEEGVEAFFEDGTTEQGSFLIGADGGRSAVRKQFYPSCRFLDTTSCCIYGKSLLNSELESRFPEKFRRWITVVQDKSPLIESIISGVRSWIVMVLEPVRFSNRDLRDDLPKDCIHWGLLFLKDHCGLSGHAIEEALKDNPSGLSLDITSQ